MKYEQEKAKQKEELKLIELIIKRLKNYFSYILNRPEETHPAPTYPFFKYLSKTSSNVLLKLGIELNVQEESGSKHHQLILLDKYQIRLGNNANLRKGDKKEKIQVTEKNISRNIKKYNRLC